VSTRRRAGSLGVLVLYLASILSACTSAKPPTVVEGPHSLRPPGSFPSELPPLPPSTAPSPRLPEEYRLAVGDTVEVSLYRQDVRENDDMRRQMQVRPDGKISYFFIGEIQAAGRTPEEVRQEINTRLASFFRSPESAVLVIEPSKKRVYVVGQVNEQGVRELRAGQNDTLLDALFLSKGLTPKANTETAYIIRREELVRVELGELLFRGDQRQNRALQTEDVVYVPEVLDQKVFVLGHVQTPGAYEVTRPIRLTEALAMAGDVKVSGRRDDVKIIRGGLPKGPEPPEILAVDAKMVREGQAPDVYVHRGDIVFVPPTPLGRWNEILSQLLPTLNVALGALVIYGVFRPLPDTTTVIESRPPGRPGAPAAP
jgi:polysaccharide export outer membrane protein